MENVHVSSSEVSTNSSNSGNQLQTIVNECKQSLDDECKEKDKTSFELNLDLRNVLNCEPTAFEADQDNENSLEKLSAVLEQPEDSPYRLEGAQSTQDDREDKQLNYILRERIQSLRNVMSHLKEELKREIEFLKKENEELQVLRERNDSLALEEATAAARAAAAAYAAEVPLSNSLEVISEDTFRELTILEYEKKLAKYQDEYSFNQAEKRYNTRWKMIANAYKQKLMEVERLCNEELEKVQQNANDLQPLKEMVSQWCIDEENRGDSIKRSDFNVDGLKYSVFNDEKLHNRQFQNVDAEVNMAPEIFVARFKSENLTKKDTFYR
ncbi:uncharacterized protein LOC117604855 [Osmia lignaria lignaria]|uniref:uncharacterized protein LOC117604855 n=1 Tax=Osmia lignaria lignaria TaxID=1437193 RepID=UPI001478AA85|nr:uncharacterized protein LOC117604855 [Osmia lignaria]